MISAGFGETGEEGRERQASCSTSAGRPGMRLIGPNCMGVINTDPDGAHERARSRRRIPPEGRVAFMSQSGALGIAVINMANALALGLSSFVSVGNKADISRQRPALLLGRATRARTSILLYLESFGNPQRFARLVRRVGRRKPIVAVKSGRERGRRTGLPRRTPAPCSPRPDRTVDALLRQVGVIRTDTLEEMFDVATLLANQPVPAGPERRHRDQRRRPRDPVRRHVRGARPARARAGGRARSRSCARSFRRRRASRTRST